MPILDAVNEVSDGVYVPSGGTLSVVVEETGFLGTIVAERNVKGAGAWAEVGRTSAAGTLSVVNDQAGAVHRARLLEFTPRQRIAFSAEADAGDLILVYGEEDPITVAHDDETPAATLQAALRLIEGLEAVTVTGDFVDGFIVTFAGLTAPEVLADDSSDLEASSNPVTITITELEVDLAVSTDAADVVEEIYRARDGRVVLAARADGKARAPLGLSTPSLEVNGLAVPTNPNNIATSEDLTTNGATATAVGLDVYQSVITTGGSEGAEEVTVGDGTGAVVGQRKLITVATLTHASDVPTLDHANIVNAAAAALAAVTLDAEGAFLLVEWNGAKWQEIYSGDATLTAS